MGLQAPLSWTQVAALALAAGWAPGDAVTAVSITEPESGRVQNIVQQGQPYATTGWGLWQITPGNSVPQFGIDDQMLIGINNARAGHFKWREAGGFTPWTTWVNGLNVPFLPKAEAAVAAVAGLTPGQLERIIASTSHGDRFPLFTPDAGVAAWAGLVTRRFRQYSRDLVWERMELARMGRPGWLP